MKSAKPVIGVLGGIGSGKSAAAEALTRHGGRVVSADPVGHDALRDENIRLRIAKRWPSAIDGDGSVNRTTLGRSVFADAAQLKELEAIVFPWIKAGLREQIDAARADANVRYVVLDAAVMLEAGFVDACDKLIFVDAPRELRLARVSKRGWSPEDLDRRERSQVSLAEKQRRADAVLPNVGTLDELQRHADDILARWGLRTAKG